MVALASGRAVVHDVLDVTVEKEIGETSQEFKSWVAVGCSVDHLPVWCIGVMIAVNIKIISILIKSIRIIKIIKYSIILSVNIDIKIGEFAVI